MKVAIYSSGGNGAESNFMSYYNFIPTRAQEWDNISEMYPEHDFKVYIAPHGGISVEENGEDIFLKAKNVPYTIIPLSYGVEEVADLIAKDSPDVAIAVTTPSLPYDYAYVRDSLVADRLREKGIRAIAHSSLISEEAFEKHKINKRLRDLGFKVPDGIFVNKHLYDANHENTGIVRNVYRDFIAEGLRKLTFPVIIKYDSGAGSIGLSIAHNIEEAIKIMDSDKSGMDMIIEERIQGMNFGAEIFGCDGNYSFKGPVIFSSNEEGVTDPFESIKYGPVKNEKFKINELKEDMHRLAKKLDLCGGAQIDLMFTGEEWYIIEINPRMSLMSMLISAIEGRNNFLNLVEHAFTKVSDLPDESKRFAIDFKTAIHDENIIENVCKEYKSIKTAMRFDYPLADRSILYTEIALGGFDKPEDLINELKTIRSKYPDIVSDKVIKNAENIVAYTEG